MVGYVLRAEEHIVYVCADEKLQSKPSQIAYEDLRLAPSSSLLQELDDIELGRTSYIEAEEEMRTEPPQKDSTQPEETPFFIPEEDTVPPIPVDDVRAVAIESAPTSSIPSGSAVVQSEQDITNTDLLESVDNPHENEHNLWAQHRSSRSLLAKQPSTKKVNRPSLDIGTTSNAENREKDIGDTSITPPKELPTSLESIEQELLQRMRQVVGDQPISESKLQFAPRWILDKAISKEKANYKEKNAYIPMSIRSLPRRSNIISSHHFFHIKTDGKEGKLKLKCRLVPHGNRDAEKESVRTDSSTARFACIRLLLSLATILHFTIASLDISAAYLQAGALGRDIYMRPPKGWTAFIDEIWKLVKPAYGLVESGRLWQLCIEKWFAEYGLEIVPGMPQLFIFRCNTSRRILLLVAKVVDDLLLAGTDNALSTFREAIMKRFKVGRYTSGSSLLFNRLHITRQENGDVHISMREFLDTIDKLELSRSRRKEQDKPATLAELRSLQALAGKLNYLGHGILPQASLVASKIQQFVGDLRVHHLSQANAALFQIKRLEPTLLYRAPSRPGFSKKAYLLSFSDASTGTGSYGQTGFVAGLLLPAGGIAPFHCLDWHSSKQSRVSFSSIGAEILAAADSADRSILLVDCLTRILSPRDPISLAITVDSFGLYSTITTLHEGRDYRLRPTVARLRDSFESREITALQWVPGSVNLADSLTKINPDAFIKLNKTLKEGFIDSTVFNSCKRSLGTMNAIQWSRD